ncbi:MAG: energy transducer TonB [Rikenellaceae bacterium]
MKLLPLIALLALVTTAQAKKIQYISPDELHAQVDVEPKFKGKNIDHLIYHIRDNIKIPNDVFRAGVSAVAEVEFVVEQDGSISNVEIVNETFKGLARRVRRKVNSAPKLTPALKDGEAVRYKASFAVGFDVDANSAAKRTSYVTKRTTPSYFSYKYKNIDIPSVNYSIPQSVDVVVKNISAYSLNGTPLTTGFYAAVPSFTTATQYNRLEYSVFAKRGDDPTNGSYKYHKNHIHNFRTAETSPQIIGGGTYAEYLDLMFEKLNNVEGYDFKKKGVPFNKFIHERDGSISYTITTTSNKEVIKNIRHALDELPKLTPATIDGEAVRYEYSFAKSGYKALKTWSTTWSEDSFAQSVNSSIEGGFLVNVAFVDKLPTYNNASLNAYKRSLIGRAVEKLAMDNKPNIGSVDIRIVLGRSGDIGKVDVVWKGKNENFAKAVAEAYFELPNDLWQPAEIGGKAVDCIIWL